MAIQIERLVAIGSTSVPSDPIGLVALFMVVASAITIALLLIPSVLRWRDARRRRPLYTPDEVDAMLEAAERHGFRKASTHFDRILSGLEQLEGLPRGRRVSDHEKGRLAS